MREARFWRVTAPLVFVLVVAAGFPLVRLGVQRLVMDLDTARAFGSLGEGVSYGLYHSGGDQAAHETIRELAAAGGPALRIVSVYQAWGLKWENEFLTRRLEGLSFDGRIPMITWEPWLVDWYLPEGVRWDRHPLLFISGGGCDDYVRAWARAAAAYQRVLLVRFAHEMNNPFYPWGRGHGDDPETFKRAWRRVRGIFEAEGARNVLWVWSPYRTDFSDYYPGAAEVDWVGYTLLNYGEVCPDERWREFQELMDAAYPALAALDRPIILTEFGSLAEGGDPEAWVRRGLERVPTRYPKVRAAVFFHSDRDANWPFPSKPSEGVGWPMDWTGGLRGLRPR